jgi:signal peptidase II
MQERIGRRLTLALVIATTIGCDRVTKDLAVDALAGTPPRSFLADTFRLAYVENTGGFLGLGASLPPAPRFFLFTLATGLMLLALVVFAIRSRGSGWPLFGVTLFASGGASNWIDRAVHGGVVDFMNVGIGPVRTGIFNVADVAIMLGAAIFMLGELRRERTS